VKALNLKFNVNERSNRFRESWCHPYTRCPVSHLADAHCCGSHVHFLILWPLSISRTSETVAHHAAGCDVLQPIHRADKTSAQGYNLLLLFGFCLFCTIFFGWYIIIYVIFPRPSTQEVSDLRPSPSMHGLAWHLFKQKTEQLHRSKQIYFCYRWSKRSITDGKQFSSFVRIFCSLLFFTYVFTHLKTKR
jgi:hypothetical protein